MVICKGIPALDQHGLFYHIASFIANREYMLIYGKEACTENKR